jgi:hypothetical protein
MYRVVTDDDHQSASPMRHGCRYLRTSPRLIGIGPCAPRARSYYCLTLLTVVNVTIRHLFSATVYSIGVWSFIGKRPHEKRCNGFLIPYETTHAVTNIDNILNLLMMSRFNCVRRSVHGDRLEIFAHNGLGKQIGSMLMTGKKENLGI